MNLESSIQENKIYPIPTHIIENLNFIIIHPESMDSAVAQRVLTQFPKEKILIGTEDESLKKISTIFDKKGVLTKEQFDLSKKILMIKKFDGYFFKRCPGAHQKKTLNCCNYYVLNLGQQCNFNCSYCYLQSYLNSPIMYVYSNIDQALAELEQVASEHPDLPFRVGTGEVTDSLSLDELTLYSRKLISFFKKYPKWILEFKTKSDLVDQFLDCEHAQQLQGPSAKLRGYLIGFVNINDFDELLGSKLIIEAKDLANGEIQDLNKLSMHLQNNFEELRFSVPKTN